MSRPHEDAPLPDLAELVGICDLTVRHLMRAFREKTGETLARATDAVTVRCAQAMLRQGAAVKDVAASLGYLFGLERLCRRVSPHHRGEAQRCSFIRRGGARRGTGPHLRS